MIRALGIITGIVGLFGLGVAAGQTQFFRELFGTGVGVRSCESTMRLMREAEKKRNDTTYDIITAYDVDGEDEASRIKRVQSESELAHRVREDIQNRNEKLEEPWIKEWTDKYC